VRAFGLEHKPEPRLSVVVLSLVDAGKVTASAPGVFHSVPIAPGYVPLL
jgi:hypothetical protein